MKKVLRIGSIGGTTGANVFIKAEYEQGKLSISGVIGPLSNGNARGGCGQIDMEFAHANPADNDSRYDLPIKPDEITFAPGWTAEKWLHFLDVWKRYHLNDMQAGCEHQRALGWNRLASKEVTLHHFRLTPAIRKRQKELEEQTVSAASKGLAFNPSASDIAYMNLPYSLVWHRADLPDMLTAYYEPQRPLYAGDRGATETKTLGWLTQSEHPDGILSRACPTCGYHYGSAWRREDIPAEVISFIESLPDTDVQPAWV